MEEVFERNVGNIKTYTDIFGNPIERLRIKDRIGFLPISVWEPDWTLTRELKDRIGDYGQSRTESKGRTYHTSLGSDKKFDMSTYNPHLAIMILAAYCPQEAKILDQFGGGGTRGFIATEMGHKYFGIELRENEVNRIKEKQKELGIYFQLEVGDSTKFRFDKKEYFDFSFTCPPYYDLEVYSKRNDDLSAFGTYDEFMNGMKSVLSINYESLKPGAFSIWTVGNFRDKTGRLTHFNGDIVKIAESCGFILWDEIIWWGASKSAVQRCGNFLPNRKSVRVHESVLVLKKEE